MRFPTTPLVVATCYGEVELTAGVDTYAAVSVCDTKVARRCGWTVHPSSVGLQAIDGRPLPVVGSTEVEARLPGSSRVVTIRLIVIENLQVEEIQVLLGVDTHCRFGSTLQVDLETNQAHYIIGAIQENVGEGEEARKKKSEAHGKNFHAPPTVIDLDDFSVHKGPERWKVTWRWAKTPPPALSTVPRGPGVYRSKWISAKHKETAFRELQTWLKEGYLTYIGEISDLPGRGWLPLRLVKQEHKSSTPVRVAVDLTWLNQFVAYHDEASKYEKCFDTTLKWRRTGWGYSADLSKAFLQVEVEEQLRKFLTIKVGQSLYELNRLPFGLSISPRVLYEILTAVLQGLDVSFFRDDLFVANETVMQEAVARLQANGFAVKTIDRVGPDMAPVKLLGLTLSWRDGQVHWVREEKYPGEHTVPSGDITVREALGYLARLLPSGLVPVANWLRPTVADLRSLLTTQANVDGWDTIVSQPTEKKLQQLSKALGTFANPMQGPWQIAGQEAVLFVDASTEFLGFILCVAGLPVADGCQAVTSSMQINTQELEAIVYGMSKAIDYKFSRLKIITDSATVHSWVEKIFQDLRVKVGGLHEKVVRARLEIIQDMCRCYKLDCTIELVAGSTNPADKLTRPVGKFNKVIGNVSEQVIPDSHRKLHEKLLHPSALVLQKYLLRTGAKIPLEELSSIGKTCMICCKKNARLNNWKSTGSCFVPGQNEVFADTLKFTDGGIVTMIAADSRFAMIWPFVGSVNANTVLDALGQWQSQYSSEWILRSDNGSEFVNDLVASWCKQHEIVHHTSTIYHPQSNGVIERFHRTLIKAVRVQPNQLPWKERVWEAVQVYNALPHKSLGYRTPAEVWFKSLNTRQKHQGNPDEDEEESVFGDDDETVQFIEDAEPTQETVWKVDGTGVTYEVGQKVLYKDPGIREKDKEQWREAVIKQVLGRGAYSIQIGNKTRKVNSELLTAAGAVHDEDAQPITNVPDPPRGETHGQGHPEALEDHVRDEAIDIPNEEEIYGEQTVSEEVDENIRRSKRSHKPTKRLIENF